MEAMGLPAGFTSAYQREAEAEAQAAAYEAQVAAAWAHYSPYAQPHQQYNHHTHMMKRSILNYTFSKRNIHTHSHIHTHYNTKCCTC